MRGEETVNTLANFIDAFRHDSTTYLYEAMVTDVDLYEATKDQRGKRVADPSHVEETPTVALLKVLVEQNQAVIHWLSSAAPKGTRRPKLSRMPRPKTAEQIWLRREARRAYDVVDAAIVYVPDDEFQRVIEAAKHAKDTETGG